MSLAKSHSICEHADWNRELTNALHGKWLCWSDKCVLSEHPEARSAPACEQISEPTNHLHEVLDVVEAKNCNSGDTGQVVPSERLLQVNITKLNTSVESHLDEKRTKSDEKKTIEEEKQRTFQAKGHGSSREEQHEFPNTSEIVVATEAQHGCQELNTIMNNEFQACHVKVSQSLHEDKAYEACNASVSGHCRASEDAVSEDVSSQTTNHCDESASPFLIGTHTAQSSISQDLDLDGIESCSHARHIASACSDSGDNKYTDLSSGVEDESNVLEFCKMPLVPSTLRPNTWREDIVRHRDEDPRIMPIPERLGFQFDPRQMADLAVIRSGGNGCARTGEGFSLESDTWEWGGGGGMAYVSDSDYWNSPGQKGTLHELTSYEDEEGIWEQLPGLVD